MRAPLSAGRTGKTVARLAERAARKHLGRQQKEQQQQSTQRTPASSRERERGSLARSSGQAAPKEQLERQVAPLASSVQFAGDQLIY